MTFSYAPGRIAGWLIAGMVSLGPCFAQDAAPPADDGDFLFLFLNPAIPQNQFTTAPQIKLADRAGVHKLTYYAAGLPTGATPSPSDWTQADQLASLVFDVSPRALVAPP